MIISTGSISLGWDVCTISSEDETDGTVFVVTYLDKHFEDKKAAYDHARVLASKGNVVQVYERMQVRRPALWLNEGSK